MSDLWLEPLPTTLRRLYDLYLRIIIGNYSLMHVINRFANFLFEFYAEEFSSILAMRWPYSIK